MSYHLYIAKKDLEKRLDFFIKKVNDFMYKPVVFYDRKAVVVKYDPENEIIRLYNVYGFKEYLKKAGFSFDDSDKSWFAHPFAILFVEERIMERMLQAMHKQDLYTLTSALAQANRCLR